MFTKPWRWVYLSSVVLLTPIVTIIIISSGYMFYDVLISTPYLQSKKFPHPEKSKTFSFKVFSCEHCCFISRASHEERKLPFVRTNGRENEILGNRKERISFSYHHNWNHNFTITFIINYLIINHNMFSLIRFILWMAG